jgi:hypothetical protein
MVGPMKHYFFTKISNPPSSAVVVAAMVYVHVDCMYW